MRATVQKKAAVARQKANTVKKVAKPAAKPAAKKAVSSEKKAKMIYMKTPSGQNRYGQRLTGKAPVPNLKAMREQNIYTTLD